MEVVAEAAAVTVVAVKTAVAVAETKIKSLQEDN